MRHFVVLILILLLHSSAFSKKDGEDRHSKYVSYRVQAGDTLSNIFRRLKLYPIWTTNGSIAQTVKLNSHQPSIVNDIDNLKEDSLLILPIKQGDTRYQYDEIGKTSPR